MVSKIKKSSAKQSEIYYFLMFQVELSHKVFMLVRVKLITTPNNSHDNFQFSLKK